jgi:putative NIF3 family GTP cyclohydrolase 1 type 2
MRLSRRSFVRAAAGSVLLPGLVRGQVPPGTAPSGQQLVDRIKSQLGGPWREKTVDGFKAGDAGAVVTGIAVTVSATRGVLERAVAMRRNLVITQEPVFYNANDEPGNRANDTVYTAKKSYIEQHRLAVFRFSDHWNARQPDPRIAALAESLSWKGSGRNGVYEIPPTSFGALTTDVRQRLQLRGGLRVVGDDTMRVRTVLLSPGTTDVPTVMARLGEVDVVIAGEPREWEVVPYLLDAREAGAAKGLLSIGRVVSEEPGMRACAAWIKSFTPEVPIDAIPVGDPYWSASA